MAMKDVSAYEAKLKRATRSILEESARVPYFDKRKVGNLMCRCSGMIPRANQVAKGPGDTKIRSLVYGHSLDLTECARDLGKKYKRATGKAFNYKEHVDEFGYQVAEGAKYPTHLSCRQGRDGEKPGG